MLLPVGLVEDNFVLVVDTNNKAIRQIDLSTESVWTIPSLEMNYPVGIDFNPTDRKVYWTDLRGDAIKRVNLNGTSEEIVSSLHSGEMDPRQIPRWLCHYETAFVTFRSELTVVIE